MKVVYREAARTDLIRQYRYYLVKLGLPHVALRFKEAVSRAVNEISRHPAMASPSYSSNLSLQGLRSWPVAGFQAIRL